LPWSGNELTSQPGITVKNEREVDSPRSAFGGEMKLFSRVSNTGQGQRVRFLRLFSGWSFHGTRV
jgi:hypothetical protein